MKNSKTLQDFRETYFTCNCGVELLQVIHYKDEVSSEFYIALYKLYNYNNSLLDRIIYAIRYLWTGKIYKDQICLSNDDAKRLSNFINKRLNNENKL